MQAVALAWGRSLRFTRERTVSKVTIYSQLLRYCLFKFWNIITQAVALCFLPEQRPGTPADDHNNHQGEERVQIESVQ